MNENNHSWLSILDYALRNKVSVSTVRRYIKGQKVKYKSENGKYLIFSADYSGSETKNFSRDLNRETIKLEMENETLKREIKRIQEEISELKMLVEIYETSASATERERKIV